MIQLKSAVPFDQELIDLLSNNAEVDSVSYLHTVLPLLWTKNISVPFENCDEMLAYSKAEELLSLPELTLIYESRRGDISKQEVKARMRKLVEIMDASIRTGLAGTTYQDRILGAQSLSFKEKMDASALLDGGMLNRMILYTIAVMETKSSTGLIVAAPTAGS